MLRVALLCLLASLLSALVGYGWLGVQPNAARVLFLVLLMVSLGLFLLDFVIYWARRPRPESTHPPNGAPRTDDGRFRPPAG